jgi:starch phosphorylase
LGFARRATEYKRATLLFSDLKRLKKASERGKFQLIFAGKAHPRDEAGKELIREIYNYRNKLKDDAKIVFLENYNIEMAAKLTSGVDVWLNTPLPPFEASGTSGMKAAHNGVINFSVLDGWWIEGCIEGFTGWAIGPKPDEPLRLLL